MHPGKPFIALQIIISTFDAWSSSFKGILEAMVPPGWQIDKHLIINYRWASEHAASEFEILKTYLRKNLKLMVKDNKRHSFF